MKEIFNNLAFESTLVYQSITIKHCWLFSQTQRTKRFLFVIETLYLGKLNLYCSQPLFQFLSLFFTLYSCCASSTSISFFSHFLSLFFWIFNKVNIQFWGFKKLRLDYLNMDLHFSYTCVKVTFHLSMTGNPGWL